MAWRKPELPVLITHARTTKWYTLGVVLRLDTKRLDAIRREYQGVDERLLKMYDLWLDANPNATYKDVIKALESEPLQEMVNAAKLGNYLQTGIMHTLTIYNYND